MTTAGTLSLCAERPRPSDLGFFRLGVARPKPCSTRAVFPLGWPPLARKADLPPELYAYRPSKKSIKRAVEKVHALTDRSGTWQETTKLMGKLNRTLRVRIPTQSGHRFRFESGHRSDLKPATIPK